MNTRTAACAALLALAALTGCSSGSSSTEADAAACKAAMAKRFNDGAAGAYKATATPTPTDRPAACAGVDDATARRLAGEVAKEWLDSDAAAKAGRDALASAAAEATASTLPSPTGLQLTDECHDWIEKELLDSTSDIDGTAGYGACGDLTDDEMTQAVDQVTQALIDATP